MKIRFGLASSLPSLDKLVRLLCLVGADPSPLFKFAGEHMQGRFALNSWVIHGLVMLSVVIWRVSKMVIVCIDEGVADLLMLKRVWLCWELFGSKILLLFVVGYLAWFMWFCSFVNFEEKRVWWLLLELSNGSAWPGGPAHINGSEWVGPLDSWATKVDRNPISSGLHGSMGQPDPYFKMYYFVFFEKKLME